MDFMGKEGPCKNCEDREVGCHSTCDKYIKYCEKNEEIKKSKRYNSMNNYATGWGYMRKDKRRGH